MKICRSSKSGEILDLKNKYLILRKIRYGESDLIIHGLSITGARMNFIARGALRSQKRFGGGILDPLNFVQLTYQQAAEGKLSTLKDATLINDFPGLRKDYDRLEFALKMLEAVGKVCQEGDTGSAFLFNLLGNGLTALEKAAELGPLKLQFWLKFLLQQGVLVSEPWMAPFLKANISESEKIQAAGLSEIRRLRALELQVEDYIKNATL